MLYLKGMFGVASRKTKALPCAGLFYRKGNDREYFSQNQARKRQLHERAKIQKTSITNKNMHYNNHSSFNNNNYILRKKQRSNKQNTRPQPKKPINFTYTPHTSHGNNTSHTKRKQKRIDSINKNQDLEEPETTLILSRLERLERKLSSKDNLEKHSLPITPETQDRIISIAAEVYGNDLLEDAKRKIEETAQERIENQKNIRIFQEIANRLLIEIESQKTKSIINLIIGILFATIGISALFYFFITPTINQHENNSATLELIQRSSFVLLIEVLAYFFLNLHKREARETRYYQNEITNIQLKLIATNLAAENNTSKDSIIKELARAERNFILEKGQTTTDLEKDRISTTSENDLTRLISSISYPKSQRRQ